MKVALGMSGGIDSSATLIRLLDQGYDVTAVTLKLRSETDETGKCCSLDDINDVRKLCSQFKVSHYILNAKDLFKEKVIHQFIKTYMKGETPNPCIECNSKVRFYYLYLFAEKLKCDFFATGHYAIINNDPREFALKRALDLKKDQSYFLSQVPKKILEKCLFPLGSTLKEENKKLLKERGIPIFKKKESYEICFVPGKNYASFLKEQKYLPLNVLKGKIINEAGEELGEHPGLIHYTIGQRRGINLALKKPAYVRALNTKTQELIIGEKPSGEEAYIKNLNIFEAIREDLVYSFQIRLRGKMAEGSLKKIKSNLYKIKFKNKMNAISPGQVAVGFLEDKVIFSGIISKENTES